MNRTIAQTGEATYCPEDNKLRLYVGRVPRDEYEALRAEGWTSTPKQSCDFVAVWSVCREDTALLYGGGVIGDEDQSPQDRAADRAERFSVYRDKRHDEATGRADQYDAGPQFHGYQSQALAERRANQHDRIATRAVNLWEKAEYWQQRTAGVISHALHVSTPGVRMGRIKILEAEIRRAEKNAKEYAFAFSCWKKIIETEDAEKAGKAAYLLANTNPHSYGYHYQHPRPESMPEHLKKDGTSLYTLITLENDPITGREAAALWLAGRRDPSDPESYSSRMVAHDRLRLAYENQMLESQGGRAAFVEMEAGGWIGKHQIQKVCKSPATGRVVSVVVLGPTSNSYDRNGKAYGPDNPRPVVSHKINVERLKSDIYRAPTQEERAAFLADKKKAKEARGTIPTINPTPEEAERLQAQFNAEAAEADKGANYPRRAGTAEQMTQAHFSGMYKDYRTVREYRGVKVRVCVHGWQHVESVVILTDKPQKPFPAGVWNAPAAVEAVA